ncbi:hypothetical protein F200043G1_22060 [[Clostridium] innocuum]
MVHHRYNISDQTNKSEVFLALSILPQLSFSDYTQFTSDFEYLGGLQDLVNVLSNIPEKDLYLYSNVNAATEEMTIQSM